MAIVPPPKLLPTHIGRFIDMSETFLPSIHNDQPITAQSDAVTVFVEAWMAALKERAKLMVCDSRLMRCAELHAQYLASRTGDELLQSMHRGQGGSYSNQRAIEAGYRLPSEYSPFANNIESCARESRGPELALIGLLNSPSHAAHLLGIDGFSDRTVYGIGNCEADWVVVICPAEPKGA